MAKKITIGTNLVLDIVNISSDVLNSRRKILNLLKNLLKETKSTPVGKPIVKKIKSYKYPYEGYSIIQVIQESHIAFHTWPEYKYLAVDIFSCNKIKKSRIVKFFKKNFKTAKIKTNEYERYILI